MGCKPMVYNSIKAMNPKVGSIYPVLFTFLALRRCKASNFADIVHYFKEFATKQMRKDKSEQYSKVGISTKAQQSVILLIIKQLIRILFECDE